MPRINISFDDVSFCVVSNLAKQSGQKPGTYCRKIIKKTLPKFDEMVLEGKFIDQNLFNKLPKKRRKR
jgi:hypothetical protein